MGNRNPLKIQLEKEIRREKYFGWRPKQKGNLFYFQITDLSIILRSQFWEMRGGENRERGEENVPVHANGGLLAGDDVEPGAATGALQNGNFMALEQGEEVRGLIALFFALCLPVDAKEVAQVNRVHGNAGTLIKASLGTDPVEDAPFAITSRPTVLRHLSYFARLQEDVAVT